MSCAIKLMLLVFLTRLCNCQQPSFVQSRLYNNATEEIAPESEHVADEKYMCTDSLQCSEMEEGEPKFCHFNTEGHSWGYCVKCSDVHQFGCSYHADKNGHHERWEEECKDVCESVNNVCEDDENNKMEIMCPEHQVILIFSISFGRINSHICPKNETEEDSEKEINTSCVSEFSWPVAFQKCMGMQNCTLEASVEEFGDPCPGTTKYLSVSHTCRPKACENSLICGKGGFCNDEKMGFCEFCSDLTGSCSDQKNLTTFALEECQATCEVPEDFFPRKKLTEACGPCDCPPRMTEGDCEDGLECVFNEVIPDLPGTCMKPVNCCKENNAKCLACEQRQEIWEYCRFHPWLRLEGCEEFYETCGKVQCWKNEECCKMKCDENGSMIPDSQCLPTSPESPGCPLFVCEPPTTTNKPIIDETREDDVNENPFFSLFLKKLNLYNIMN